MMQWFQQILFHNWRLKLFSLVIATMLWAATARESTSEIGVNVALEYQNVPANTEVISDTTNTVEVRLRGPSTLIKEISPQDISVTADMGKTPVGNEKILPLTSQQVRAPFGVEVVGVNPARVRVTLEPTISARLRIHAAIVGAPAEGMKVEDVTVTPDSVKVEGPANRVRLLENVLTTPVDVSDKTAGFVQSVDLNILDPRVRVPQSPPVRVEVRIGPK
jgi:YbbR domain-containing protein